MSLFKDLGAELIIRCRNQMTHWVNEVGSLHHHRNPFNLFYLPQYILDAEDFIFL